VSPELYNSPFEQSFEQEGSFHSSSFLTRYNEDVGEKGTTEYEPNHPAVSSTQTKSVLRDEERTDRVEQTIDVEEIDRDDSKHQQGNAPEEGNNEDEANLIASIEQMRERGIELSRGVGGRKVYAYPASKVTAADAQWIQRHKAQVLVLLRQRMPDALPARHERPGRLSQRRSQARVGLDMGRTAEASSHARGPH
jgi:hypothetical protein